jgi:lipid-A-disaccharide synthase
VAYRTSALEYAVARRLVKIPFIGLVNIVAGREIAREFVQDALEPLALADALEPLLDPHSVQRRVLVQHLGEVRDSLGQPGAARRVAAMALELAESSAVGVVR